MATTSTTPLNLKKEAHEVTPIHLLHKCNSIRELKQIQGCMIKTSVLQHDPNLLTKLTAVCTALKPLDHVVMRHARLLFDQAPQPNIFLFNTVARGYSRTGHDSLQVVELFSRILLLGILPNDYTFPSLLKACTNSRALEEGKQVHSFVIKLGLHHNTYIAPTLINMYADCGDCLAARQVFDRIEDPCVVIYNSMITGYARNSQPNMALVLFRGLQKKNLKPTHVTLLSVLASCTLLGALNLGKWVHDYIKKNGFDRYVKVNTALIDMYAKCGSLEDAITVFENMRCKDTQAWSTMIVACAIHGQGPKAISVFNEMNAAEIQPDAVTLLGLLYACNHSGMVDEGLAYFHYMTDKYGIPPTIKHYGCMVDLLSRAGRLNEAYEFIKDLPIRPTPILWRTLLSACYNHGNVELGKLVSERIFELDESHGGDYVILSNMCARAGEWKDVNYFRKLMKDRGAVKVPGCSSVEVDNVVHEFFSGDGTHPSYRALHRVVDELVEKLKLVGYVPDTSVVFHADMAEEDKEISLRYHSEKLAIAFALINSPPGSTIRVVKNLRICGDCHSAAKYMSMVLNTHIILRDVQRFHHFKDGVCSCGDYW
ncbi:hypothetical protein Syun_022795 [Stephania yunnanensis]|uniref:DYW domain-containing protein n=1 Tax=Stephania yunnanensis TaxID=152371 RepID=A0AAP0I3E7_9MAGN